MLSPLLRRPAARNLSYYIARPSPLPSPASTRIINPLFSRSVYTTTMTSTGEGAKYKLIFFVPNSHAETCKDAVFEAGAGSFPGGKYSRTCFQCPGVGQFLPGDAANPNIGSVGALEKVQELKVEVLCLGRPTMTKAVEALLKAHPYEEPGYEVYRMEDI